MLHLLQIEHAKNLAVEDCLTTANADDLIIIMTQLELSDIHAQLVLLDKAGLNYRFFKAGDAEFISHEKRIDSNEFVKVIESHEKILSWF